MIVINEHITDIATFDMMPTDDYFPGMFNLREKEFKPVNARFLAFKFETQNFLMILGSLFVIFLWIISRFIIGACLSCKCCQKNKCMRKLKNWLNEGLVWNDCIDYVFSAYAELLFALCLHSGSNDLSWEHQSSYFPNVCFYLFAVICAAFPFWMIYFLNKRYYKLHEEEYRRLY
jgi:hypothetical protein